MGKKRVRHGFALAVALTACAGEAAADRFSVTSYYEFYAPKLEALREGAQKAPLHLSAETLDSDGAFVVTSSLIGNDVAMAEYEHSPGLRLQYRVSDNTAVYVGFAAWEFAQGATVQTDFPLVAAHNSALYTRSNRLSFDEYVIGIKQLVLNDARRYRISLGAAAHQLHDIDYVEGLDFHFVSGPAAGQSRYLDVSGISADALWGVNLFAELEKPLTKQWALSFSAGYFHAPGKQPLNGGGAAATTDLSPNDDVLLKLPLIVNASGEMQYLSADGASYQTFTLDFSGFRAALAVSYSF